MPVCLRCTYPQMWSAIGVACNGKHVERAFTSVVTGSGVTVANIPSCPPQTWSIILVFKHTHKTYSVIGSYVGLSLVQTWKSNRVWITLCVLRVLVTVTSSLLFMLLATVRYHDGNSIRREMKEGNAETKACMVVPYACLSVNIIFIKEITVLRNFG
jgi:hypothetical protein